MTPSRITCRESPDMTILGSRSSIGPSGQSGKLAVGDAVINVLTEQLKTCRKGPRQLGPGQAHRRSSFSKPFAAGSSRSMKRTPFDRLPFAFVKARRVVCSLVQKEFTEKCRSLWNFEARSGLFACPETGGMGA